MSNFVVDLFQSIFTPGPTPTLLVATNITFACLQLVFLLLLIATYSIHFIVLSFLSAGLWWSINWFAAELKVSQAAEQEKQRRLDETKPGEDSDTEAETVTDTGDAGLGSKDVEVTEQQGELRGRGGMSRSELSTEDEWERVSENEKDK